MAQVSPFWSFAMSIQGRAAAAGSCFAEGDLRWWLAFQVPSSQFPKCPPRPVLLRPRPGRVAWVPGRDLTLDIPRSGSEPLRWTRSPALASGLWPLVSRAFVEVSASLSVVMLNRLRAARNEAHVSFCPHAGNVPSTSSAVVSRCHGVTVSLKPGSPQSPMN